MTAESGYTRAATALLHRGQVHRGDVFVGRRRELNYLLGVSRPTSVASMWVYGPRRVGKTSLVARAQTAPGSRLDLSLSGREWGGLDYLCGLILQELDQNGHSFAHFETYLRDRREPLVVVIDEFDGIAVDLKKHDQFGMRKMADKNAHFGWTFISRARPDQLCQDFDDESSRLVGICTQLRVPLLTETEVQRLLVEAARVAQQPFTDGVGRWIYERVGGHPLIVRTLMAHILLDAEERGDMRPLEKLGEESFEARLFSEVKSDLSKLWLDLPEILRNHAASSGEREPNEEVRSECASLNLDARTFPSWLLRVARISESSSHGGRLDTLDLAGQLSEVCRSCGRFTGSRGTTVKLFHLARPARSEADLRGIAQLTWEMMRDCRILSMSASDPLSSAFDRFVESDGIKMLKAFLSDQEFAEVQLSRKSRRSALALEEPPQLPLGDVDWGVVQRNLLAHVASSLQELLHGLQSVPNSAVRDFRGVRVYIEYSNDDERHLRDLRMFLKPLEDSGVLLLWDRSQTEPGSVRDEMVRIELSLARVAVLLLSPSLLARPDMDSALESIASRADKGDLVILPLLVRVINFESLPISRFEPINRDKPLSGLSKAKRDEIFLKVSDAIRRRCQFPD